MSYVIAAESIEAECQFGRLHMAAPAMNLKAFGQVLGLYRMLESAALMSSRGSGGVI